MNAPLSGSRLVDSASFLWLKPVRSAGSFVHFVPRDKLSEAVPALCGEKPPRTDRGTTRWRVVHAATGKVCGACHAASLAGPTRIDWS